MNELQTTNQNQDLPWISPTQLTHRIGRMLEVQKNVMKKEVHYGVIPGCQKPTLYKPGAQLLNMTFGVGTKPFNVEDLSSSEEKHYRVTLEVFNQSTGMVLGYGVGECSSMEEKYAWKKAVCDEEYNDTPDHMRREKYFKGKGGNGHYKVKQIRTNPFDVANTVLKMAEKRALIDATLNVLSASEVFTQDIEDLPEGMNLEDETTSSKPSVSPSDVKVSHGENHPSEDERKSGKLISEKQGNLILMKCKENGVSPAAVAKAAGVQNVFWLTWAKNCKTNFEVMLNLVQTKPNSFSKFEPAAQEAKAAAAEQAPEVMGQDDFEKLVFSLLLGCGMSEADFDAALEAEFSIKGLKAVKPEDQSKVIDFLTAKQEQARA